MKINSILLSVIIISFSPVFSQGIINYKNKCDIAYFYFIEGNHNKFIIELEKIEKKQPLKGEELEHLAISYAQIGNKDKAIELLRKAWQTTHIDWSFRLFDRMKLDSLLALNEEQKKKLKDKNGLNQNRGIKDSDSLKKLLHELMDTDQFQRDLLFSVSDSITQDSIYKIILKNDSIAQSILNDIISKYGFPGDSICVGDQATAELLLWHATSKSFFEINNKRLFSQIDLGLISPYAYAYWYDRCMIEQKRKPKYFHFSFVEPNIKMKKLLKNRKKIGMSKYYQIDTY